MGRAVTVIKLLLPSKEICSNYKPLPLLFAFLLKQIDKIPWIWAPSGTHTQKKNQDLSSVFLLSQKKTQDSARMAKSISLLVSSPSELCRLNFPIDVSAQVLKNASHCYPTSKTTSLFGKIPPAALFPSEFPASHGH